jgi:hypothetical protein
MGWNSWNSFEVNINKKLIKETVDALIFSGMQEVDYEYIVIDDGWVICVLNTYNNTINIRFDWHHFPFLNNKMTYSIRDLWQEKSLGKTDKIFTGSISSHDVLLLKLKLHK